MYKRQLTWQKILCLRFQFQHLQDVADLLGDVVDGAGFETFINLFPGPDDGPV